MASLSSAFRKSIGFQIEDMLVSCMFDYLPCNSSDISYFYHPQYGNCYTFNKEMPVKTISVPGVTYGLTLELYLGNPPVDTVNNAIDGIIMSIHNKTDAPFTKMDVIKVPAGSETDLILNRNFITRIPPPYGSCMETGFSSELYKYILNTLNISYSQEYCFSLCMQNQTKIICGCINVFLPMFENDNTSICGPNQRNFVSDLVNNFGNSSSNTVCQSSCEFECSPIEFDIKTYNGHYPTTHYKSILQQWVQNNNKNVSYSDIPDSFAKVNVYYHSMQYLTTEQTQKFQGIDLLSNLGGVLGLWLGISLMTLIEIVELIYNLIYTFVKYRLIIKNAKINVLVNSNT